MADQAAAEAVGNGAVVGVDVGDQVVGDELLEVAGGDGTGVHGAVVHGFGIGQDDDHVLRALGEGALDCLGHNDLVRPLLGADGIAVQRVDHGVAAVLAGGVAGRQEDDDIAIDGVAFQIAFERGAVNLDVLGGDGFCAGDWWRNNGLDLGHGHCGAGDDHGDR